MGRVIRGTTMTTLFNVGDMQRLDREAALTEQSPRQEFRSPNDSITNSAVVEADEFKNEPMNPFDFMMDGLMAALKARL